MAVQSIVTGRLVEAIDSGLGKGSPERILLTTGGERLSYGTLKDRMARLNGLFQKMGLRPGERVVVSSEDDVAVVTLLFALLRAGLTGVIVDGNIKTQELAPILATADPAAFFADGALIRAAGNKIDLPNRRIVQVLPAKDLDSTSGDSIESYDTLIHEIDPDPVLPDVPGDALALIVFTSGTTSRPKGVSLTHANLTAQLDAFDQVYGFDDQSRILNVLPLHHVDGLIRGPLAALWSGGQVLRPMRFSVPHLSKLLAVIPDAGITHFVTVPVMLNLISRLADPASGVFKAPDFRFVICSADFLNPRLWRDFEARFGAVVVNAYGLSEVVCDALFCGPDEDTRRIGTLGKPTMCQARVVDPSGNDIPVGETGELLLSGPTVMRGYFRQAEATADVLRDGWFHTGDLVSTDPLGFFNFEGRKKTVVISGGSTIHPENVSTTILSMPGVVEAVSFGVPDPAWGERLVSCVVVEANAAVDTKDVMEHCRIRLSPGKVPAEIHQIDELPRGPSGKIIIDEVREIVAGMASEEPASGDIYTIASDCFQVTVNVLSPESSPYNTEGWDSMAHLEFIARLEERFEFTLSANEIVELGSLADAESIVARAKKS